MTAAASATGEAATGSGPVQLKGATLWLAGILLAMANFVAILDMSIANVSVPNIAGALGVSSSQGTWVITSYAVAEAVCVPLTGWLAARFGTVRVFATALLGFGLTSLLCGLAPTLEVLVFARILQGLCGGPLMPLSQTLLLTIYPPKLRPAALGIWAVTTLVAPIAGPTLGGVLCDNFGWASIFLINVPVAIGAAFLVWRMLSSQETKVVRARVDVVGLMLLIFWVGALQLMLDLGKEHAWFESGLIVGLAVAAAVGFIAFLIWELTEEHPIVDLRIFRHPGFSIAMVVMAIVFGGFFAINVLAPLWLQTNMAYDATTAGHATGMIGILAVMMAPIAAQLVSKVDPRRMVFVGLIWLAFVTYLRSIGTTDLSYGHIAFLIFLGGAGMPLFFMPIMSVSLGAVDPSEVASAAGLQNFIRTMSGAIATSFVITQLEDSANANHTEMLGHMPNAEAGVAAMQQEGMSRDMALATLDAMAQQQGFMMSVNQIFLACAILFAICAFMAFLMPKPARAASPMDAH